jgi:hypothetical protein
LGDVPLAVVGRGAVILIFLCRDWRDAQGASHQPQTKESDHPVLLSVALGPSDVWGPSGMPQGGLDGAHSLSKTRCGAMVWLS